MKNKITNQSYFIKRIRDSGYICDRTNIEYSENDARSWTVIVSPKKSNVLITCFNNKNELGEEFFELHDGGQYIPEFFKIKTSSIEVIVDYLLKFSVPLKER